MTSQPPPSGQFVQSLARGLAVITAFDAGHPELTLSDVAVRTGLSRATARRFLHTLLELGYVRASGRLFALTPRVLGLGTAYLASLGLPQIAQPYLESLSAQLGESTSAAILDGTEIVYVARAATRRIMSVGISVGTRFPAYATSMGRVLLASLDDASLQAYFAEADLSALTPHTVHDEASLRRQLEAVRTQGWALVDQELERGLRSLAVPVRDQNTVVAAINVSATAIGEDASVLVDSALTQLQEAGRAVSDDLDAKTSQ